MYSKKNVSYVAFRTSNAITAVIELNALCILELYWKHKLFTSPALRVSNLGLNDAGNTGMNFENTYARAPELQKRHL